ncbi:hypothetical protein Bhyg_03434, partial [Pseudolycoriella hygida]
CPSPIRGDCDVAHDEDDPLSIQETPIVDRHTVPAPSPQYEPDEENLSDAHDKTADNGQDDTYIDDDEVETMNDCAGEVVRYKCVQKKVKKVLRRLLHLFYQWETDSPPR